MKIIRLNEQEVNRRNPLRLFLYDFETGIPRRHTLKRIINLFLNELTRRLIKSSFVFGYPTAINIEPTSSCNFKCHFCASGSSYGLRKQGFLEYKDYCSIIDELAPYIYKLSLYNLGEPFLSKDIFRMIAYAKQKRILVCISTNGQLLDENASENLIRLRCDHIIVSLDASTKETHNETRPGGDFDIIVNNVKRLLSMRGKLNAGRPKITLQMVVTRKNENQIEAFIRLAQALGVDACCLSSFWAQGLGSSEEEKKTFGLIPLHSQFSGYRKRKPMVAGTCPWAWNRSIINCDGNIVPCCYDYNASVKLGNIKEQAFKNIWNGPYYKLLRRSIKTNRNQPDLCKKCPISYG